MRTPHVCVIQSGTDCWPGRFMRIPCSRNIFFVACIHGLWTLRKQRKYLPTRIRSEFLLRDAVVGNRSVTNSRARMATERKAANCGARPQDMHRHTRCARARYRLMSVKRRVDEGGEVTQHKAALIERSNQSSVVQARNVFERADHYERAF